MKLNRIEKFFFFSVLNISVKTKLICDSYISLTLLKWLHLNMILSCLKELLTLVEVEWGGIIDVSAAGAVVVDSDAVPLDLRVA